MTTQAKPSPALAVIPARTGAQQREQPGPEAQLAELAGDIRELTKVSAQSILLIGEKLCRAKELLEHGKWGKWLEQEFAWSESAALKMMQVYQRFGQGKSVTVTDLAIDAKALYLLAAPSTPDPVVEEILGRARNGEQITHATVRQILEHDPDGGDHGKVRASLYKALAALTEAEPDTAWQKHLEWIQEHPEHLKPHREVRVGEDDLASPVAVGGNASPPLGVLGGGT